MSFAHYLLQVNLYLIVFYGFYKLLLDKETYFTLNRFYLVGAGVLSLSIPFIRLEWLTEQSAAQKVYTSVNWEAVLQQATIVTETSNGFNWANAFVYTYCGGILFFLCRLVFNLLAVKNLLANAKAGSAFSFLSSKIVDKNLPQMDVIHIHEEAHIKQWHTLDVLFFEVLGIITWLNPIIYFYKKSIKNIHEFLADEQAAEFQGDKAEYAMLILSKSFGISPNSLTNGFFDKSLIKKRIFMLQKERSKRIAIMKYGISIPLFALLIVFSSATVRKNENLISITDQIPLEKPMEMVKDMVTEMPFKAAKEIPLTPNIEVFSDKTWYPFYRFIGTSIKYPNEATQKNLQGNTQIKFILKNSKITSLSSAVDLGEGCDEEVMKAVLSFKGYKAIPDGKYTLRVKFKLVDNDSEVKNSKIASIPTYKSLSAITVIAYSPKFKSQVADDGDKKIYDFVSIEKQPEFPGGIRKFYEYLGRSIKYPALAQENNVQGKVFLSFIVEKNGDLSDVQITRGLGSGTDEEAVRVLKESPKWNPGISNGNAVRVKYNINVNFTLNDDEVKPIYIKPAKIGLKNGHDFKGVVLVDGVKLIDNNAMNLINPNTIEAIEILKDNNAVALYGDKARAGAILITTKKLNNSLFRKPNAQELTLDEPSAIFNLRQKF